MSMAPAPAPLPRLVLDYLRREAEATWLADQSERTRVVAACVVPETPPRTAPKVGA